ncbi:MAG: hypothetical protein HOK35_08425 [Cytophagia bacterium]|jgi:hypothetical protein|nr:hypothetical protein [Cytophagia bacterium]
MIALLIKGKELKIKHPLGLGPIDFQQNLTFDPSWSFFFDRMQFGPTLVAEG